MNWVTTGSENALFRVRHQTNAFTNHDLLSVVCLRTNYNDICHDELKKVLENDVNSATVWFANNYMCVNTDKFQSIILNRDGKHTLSISVQDNTVLSDTSITVLGVVLDDKLKFDEHVSVLCLKASRQINALNRVSKYLDEMCRIMVYKSFIQERALRFVFCDAAASYEDLLERGNFLPLSVYRIRCLGIEVFKCFHGLNLAYLNDIFIQPSLKYNLRDSCRLEQPKFRTFTYGLRSFRYYGSKLWNLLPYQMKNTRDIVTFKRNITEWCHSKQCISLEIF